MAKHKHAELMMQYAQDAMETEKPWERWEFNNGIGWNKCLSNPSFAIEHDYRRKPRTININGFEVSEPLREAPQVGDEYYVPDFYGPDLYVSVIWQDSQADIRLFERGLIHLSKEAAIQHTKALLSFT